MRMINSTIKESNKSKIKIERCVLCGPRLNNENVAHFNFPKTKFADVWKSFCVKVDPTKPIFLSSKLCCIHFTEESFSSITDRHTLKKNAIPSLNPNYAERTPRKCNHNFIDPISLKTTGKRKYGSHKYLTYCLLCKSKRTGVASFHFPKNENIRKQWIKFCQVDGTQISANSRLCQYHFAEDDFLVTKCGRVSLKSGTIPSVSATDFANYERNEKDELPNVHAEETLIDGDHIIPTKRIKLCSEIRCDEPTSSNASSWHDMSYDLNDVCVRTLSTSEILRLTKCSFCNIMSTDLVQYRFANNAAMRLLLTTYYGMSQLCLDEMNTVCISHFDDDDIDVDNDGNKMIKDRAFPWRYFSQMIAKSSYISQLAIAGIESIETASAAETNETEVTAGKLVRKRKSYVGDMTPSDFRTPGSVRKNLTFIKDKFKSTAVKVKKLQDQNRWANLRVKKVLDTICKLKEEGLITNNIAITNTSSQ